MNETHVSAQTDGQCIYFCLIFFFFFFFDGQMLAT
jgi:hypothetical protein